MTQDEAVLAAYVAGSVQAALDRARERGYPPVVGITRPDGSGTWAVVAQDSGGNSCTVTITPGSTPRSAESTDSR